MRENWRKTVDEHRQGGTGCKSQSAMSVYVLISDTSCTTNEISFNKLY